MWKHILATLASIIIIGVGLPLPVYAQGPMQKPIGTKMALSDGSEATLVGRNAKGTETWKATIGQRVYIPGTSRKYNTAWESNGTSYIGGDNTFTANVTGETVTITHNGLSETWTPTIQIGQSKRPTIQPVRLPFDDLDSFYSWNTLSWTYGAGITRYARLIEDAFQEYYILQAPIPDALWIIPLVHKDNGFVWTQQPYAYDANHNRVPITVGDDGTILFPSDPIAIDLAGNSGKPKYPITIDPDTSFNDESSDAYNYYVGAAAEAFATVRAKTTATAVDGGLLVSTSKNVGGNYFIIARSYIPFTTSSLAGFTLTAATLRIYESGVVNNTDGYSVRVMSGMPTYPHIPVVTSDFDITKYAGNGGSLALSSVNTTSYTSIGLNATGLGWINTTGTTKFTLMLSGDADNVAPTNSNGFYINDYSAGASLRPYLDVTFNANPPTISVGAASNIATTSARLNASVTDDGGEACQVRWGYGTTSQTAANFTLYDTVTAWSAAIYNTSDNPYEDITGLTSGDTYYARVQIKNTGGNMTSVSEDSFTTSVSVTAPTNIHGYPTVQTEALSWIKGLGSDTTVIRYSTSGFPADNTTGILEYQGNASSHTITGLTGGSTYYARFWAVSGDNWSGGYADYAFTTEMVSAVGDDFESATAPSSWSQSANYTQLANLEPLYSAINGVADAKGIPRNTVWMGMVIVIILIVVVVVLKAHSFAAAAIAGLVIMGFGVAAHLLPFWWSMGIVAAIVCGIILIKTIANAKAG